MFKAFFTALSTFSAPSCGLLGTLAAVSRYTRFAPAPVSAAATASAVAPVVITSSTMTTVLPAHAFRSCTRKLPRKLSARALLPSPFCAYVSRVLTSTSRPKGMPHSFSSSSASRADWL